MRGIGLTALAVIFAAMPADAQRKTSASAAADSDVEGPVTYRGTYEQRATSGASRTGEMEFTVVYRGSTIRGSYRSSSLGSGVLTGTRNGRQCNIDGGGGIGHYQCDRDMLVGSETLLDNGRAVSVISYRMRATH